MTNQEIIDSAEPLLEPGLAELGIEIVHIEYQHDQGRWVFRVFIDHEDGVNLDTCQRASKVIGQILDKKELISQAYALEVSSPGLDRLIKKDRDFARFSGRKVKVRTLAPIEGQKSFVGMLLGLENDHILLDADGKQVQIPRNNVKQVRLVVEL